MNGILFLCINLKRAPERRALMEAEARRAGIEIDFVQAVDGLDLDLGNAPGYNREGRLRHAPDLTPNEVACALSHKHALTVFLSNAASAAVILEDDAVLSPHFLKFVEAVAALPVKWDAVNLHSSNKKPLHPALVRFDFGVRLHTSAWLSKGTVAWLYSRQGAEKVLRSLSSFRHPVDTHIGFFWRHGFTPLCACPPVVTHAPNIASTICVKGQPKRTFELRELSFSQYLRARRERITHEVRKEIAARIALVRLKLTLMLARSPNGNRDVRTGLL
jgi:glycosyl transferase, family 25